MVLRRKMPAQLPDVNRIDLAGRMRPSAVSVQL